MAQPRSEPDPPEPPAMGFRVTQRTYSGDATPLARVLVMLYDWSVERELREQAKIDRPPDSK